MPSVADILLEQGRQAAEARRAGGAIWAQTAQSLAGIPGQVVGQARSIHEAETAEALRKAQTQQVGAQTQQIQGDVAAQGRTVADQAALDQYLTEGMDLPAIEAKLTAAGRGHQIPAVRKQFADADEAATKLKAAKLTLSTSQDDYFGGLAASVRNENYSPGAFSLAVSHAYGNGIIDKATAEKYLTDAQADPTSIKATVDRLIAASQAQQAISRDLTKPIPVPKDTTIIQPSATPGQAPTVLATGIHEPDSLQSESDWMLNGKPVPIWANPKTGWRGTEIGGPDLTKQLVKIPPAAIQVQNIVQNAAQNAAVSAARPDPTTANIPDKVTGLTPNARWQMGAEWALKGDMPNQGLGSTPRAQAVRSLIPNQGSAMAAAAGVDIPTLRAQYRANTTALNQLLPRATATANAMNTATDNLDLALTQSAEVARSNAKLVNRYTQWAQGELTAAKGLTQFETYIYTAAREYAKVTGGGALSAQGLTDSAQREASRLLNTAMAPDAFAAAVGAMKDDMSNVTAEQARGLSKISDTIGNFFAATNGIALTPPTPAAVTTPTQTPTNGVPVAVGNALKTLSAGRHNLSDGSVWDSDGFGHYVKVK